MDAATRKALEAVSHQRTQVTNKPNVEPPTLHRSGINRWETPDRSTIQRGRRGNVHSHEFRGQQQRHGEVMRDAADARLTARRDMATCAEWAKQRGHAQPMQQPQQPEQGQRPEQRPDR